MKANGYERATVEAAQALLSAAETTREPLRAQIRQAFAGVKLGDGVGLSQTLALDDYADDATQARYRENDEKDDWTKIPRKALPAGLGGLCFFDAKGMRFHLPVFLLAEIDGDFDNVIFVLTHKSDHTREQFSLLSDAQRQAVRAFLLLAINDADNDFYREDIDRALKEYWTETF